MNSFLSHRAGPEAHEPCGQSLALVDKPRVRVPGVESPIPLMLPHLLSLLPSRFALLSVLTTLCSFFSVISSLFPLLSLPLTAQIALAVYLLLHEWGRELPFLTITLSTSFTSKIMLLPATA